MNNRNSCCLPWTSMFFLAVVAGLVCAQAAWAVDADILLRGGTIYDGAGRAGMPGDVALVDDKVVAVGRFPVGKIGREIDCHGMVIAPGFIDLHTHSDRSIGRKSADSQNYLLQGCTTYVTGNCGGGPREVAKFLDKTDSTGTGANIIHLVPHGAVRSAVIGSANRAPTADELQKMKDLVAQGMREGAWGMSTGLIYQPSLYAKTDELIELSKVVAAHGGIYATHIRNESDGLLNAVREAIQIGREAKVQVQISHFKIGGRSNWGHIGQAMAEIEKARSAGITIYADQYPYTASSTSLFSTLVSVSKIPGGSKDLWKRMQSDPQLDRLVRDDIRNRIDRSARICIASCSKFPQYAGKDLRRIGAEERLDPVDVAVKILSNGGASAVNHAMNEADVRQAMQAPWVATGSDGSARLIVANEVPHPRNFGTFARKIGFYAIQEKVIPLEQAIRSCSGLPADILGVSDRGYLRPGTCADVVVFDPKTYIDRATFEKPQQYATGVRYVFVAGHLAVEDGKLSPTRYGRAIRHVSPTPVAKHG